MSDLMDLFTDRNTYNPEKFPCFSHRKNLFVNTEKGKIEMCEKVEQLVREQLEYDRLMNLFSYVEKGGMSVTFAAKEAQLTPKEFKMQMIKNGFTLPPRGKKTSLQRKMA